VRIDPVPDDGETIAVAALDQMQQRAGAADRQFKPGANGAGYHGLTRPGRWAGSLAGCGLGAGGEVAATGRNDNDQRAEPPFAAENRRLTRTTGPTTIRLASLKCLAVRSDGETDCGVSTDADRQDGMRSGVSQDRSNVGRGSRESGCSNEASPGAIDNMPVTGENHFRLPPERPAMRDECFHPSGTFVEFPTEDVETWISARFEKIGSRYAERTAFTKNPGNPSRRLDRTAGLCAQSCK